MRPLYGSGAPEPSPRLNSFLMLASVPRVLDESAPDFIGIPACGRVGAGRDGRSGALAHMVGVGGRAGSDYVGRYRGRHAVHMLAGLVVSLSGRNEDGAHRSGPGEQQGG